MDVSNLLIAELKEELSKRGLDTSGKKGELIARLEKALRIENGEEEEEEEEEDIGPAMPSNLKREREGEDNDLPVKIKKQRVLEFEDLYVKNLPIGDMYEISYMHRDIVTHILVAPLTDFVITASIDGYIKFWRKMPKGIEFVKVFKSHLGKINSIAVSADGAFLASCGEDKVSQIAVKIYEIISFDMIRIFRNLSFTPNCLEWITQTGSKRIRLAVSDALTSDIHIFNTEGDEDTPIHTIKLHSAPVIAMVYNVSHNVTISVDAKGMIDYWSADTFTFPQETVKFKYKSDTDLYELAKSRTIPTSITCTLDGSKFAITAKDNQVRVFQYSNGKLLRKYDESLSVFVKSQEEDTLGLDSMDFGKRMAVEKNIAADVQNPPSNCVFDESGNFLMYATLAGIKMVNIVTNKVVRIMGKVESTERFLTIALYQGTAKVNSQLAKKGKNKARDEENDGIKADPLIIASAFKKHRFYLFSTREPDVEGSADGRDIFNEKPQADAALISSSTQKQTGKSAIIRTSMGDIHIKLYPDECPRTVENFVTHAKNGYYDNVIFHRVIPNFMIQTGDPLGDGTGGESIWGGEFDDEFHRSLRHDRPFTVSMANAGPGTNGSQFFITTVNTPHLDNKHTIFGRCTKGMDTVRNIEKVKCDKLDRPLEPPKIVGIDISNS